MSTSSKITPLKHVRKFCVECCGGNSREVALCTATQCPIYDYRFGKRADAKYRPILSIRKKCYDCCEGTSKAIQKCQFKACYLWVYRLNKRPTQTMIKEFEYYSSE